MNEERKRIMQDCRARFTIARTVTDEVLKGVNGLGAHNVVEVLLGVYDRMTTALELVPEDPDEPDRDDVQADLPFDEAGGQW